MPSTGGDNASQPSPLWRDHPWIALANVGYLVAFAVFAGAQGNREFVLYSIVMILLFGMMAVAYRRVRFSTGVLVALTLWGVLHMAGGTVHLKDGTDSGVLYGFWLVPGWMRYDQAVHLYGFAVATVGCAEGLRALIARPKGGAFVSFGFALSAMLMSVGLGAINEIVEFAAKLTLPDTNVGGYENTGWDLVFNLGGSLIAAAWLYGRDLRGRRRSTATAAAVAQPEPA